MADEQGRTFEDVHERLSEIVDEVSAEDISLDDALKLYEEAVKLGLSACDLSEQDLDAFLATEEETTADAGTDPAATPAAGTDPVGATLVAPRLRTRMSPRLKRAAQAPPLRSTDTTSSADAPAPGEA